jgi:uncharacterized coiled-coil protein SlyX
MMSISRSHEEKKRTSGGLPTILLLVIAALAAIADLAIFFWPDNIDPEIRTALRFIGSSQRQATNGVEAINDSLAAEQRDLKMLSEKFLLLTARLGTLQADATQILRKNTELTDRLNATQAQ